MEYSLICAGSKQLHRAGHEEELMAEEKSDEALDQAIP
jgi:hypothetical protein